MSTCTLCMCVCVCVCTSVLREREIYVYLDANIAQEKQKQKIQRRNVSQREREREKYAIYNNLERACRDGHLHNSCFTRKVQTGRDKEDATQYLMYRVSSRLKTNDESVLNRER